ncbi:hypothetical protein C4N15_07400 [Fusobacterium necrophorum subsp. funduliforme]|uniref:terminase large subunit domain-containing protein n=1 Tax=Fusobacterium necrophorum TaxID=859 RepID=UPI000D11C07A|nr:terminase family protein [Fusobacterium necrophorum]AVQ21483.1 hypothetical protein C4N15_07400 [Fusobacterium necrophorum subsp. funduliforme]
MKIKYEIADMCKHCIKRHLKQKGKWEVECIPVPKEMDATNSKNIPFYPIQKILNPQTYSLLSEEQKTDLQLHFNKLLWAKEFLGWTPTNMNREGFYQYYQKEFLLCSAKNRVMRFGRRLGKCVADDSLILTSTRGLVKAKNLKITDRLVTFDEKTGKMYYTKEWHIEDNGYKKCLKLVTESGKEDIVTTNHPYYSKEKTWVTASELKIGDKIATPVYYHKLNTDRFNENPILYAFLGQKAAKNESISYHIFKTSIGNISSYVDALLQEKQTFSNWFFVQQLKHLMQRIGLKYKIVSVGRKYRIEIYGLHNTNEEYVFEKIAKIEPVGNQHTLAITIPKTHTFITNDIITHNTEVMSVDAIHYAINNPGSRIMIIGPFLNLITEIFDRLENLLSSSNSAFAGEYSRKKTPFEKITLKNGSVIKGFTTSTDGNSIRGQSADRIYLDEAAYLPEEAFKAFMAFKMDNQDVSFSAASTPNSLETKFKDWCKSDASWKDFHYPSSVLPNFAERDEKELRASLTEIGYLTEVEAEFVEGSDRVFKTEDLKKASSEYDYVDFRAELQNPTAWKIAIGTDYNSFKNGVQICVLGLSPFIAGTKPFKILKTVSLTKESTNGITKDLQTETVETIIQLFNDFEADYVYSDEGYGGMQNEMLSKYFFEIGKQNVFKAVDFNAAYPVTDFHTGNTINKRKKVMMVTFLQRRFEQGEITISTKMEKPEQNGSLYHQLLYYHIDRWDNKGQPIFAGADHKIDALMLANFAMIENLNELFNPTTGTFAVAISNTQSYLNAGVTPPPELYGKNMEIGVNSLSGVKLTTTMSVAKRRYDIGGSSNGGFFDSI